MDRIFNEVPRDDLVSVIGDRMKAAILGGKFAPGQRVIESDIARQMDVSRAPIREALRLLEQQGLLVAKKNAGFFIRPMDRGHIDEIYEVRIILQTAAIRLAVKRISEAELDALDYNLAQKKVSARVRGERDQLKNLIDFQLDLCACSGNERLTSFFTQISDDIRFMLNWVGLVYQKPVEVFDRFDGVVEAVRARNEHWASAAIEGFIRRSWMETIAKLEGRDDAQVVA